MSLGRESGEGRILPRANMMMIMASSEKVAMKYEDSSGSNPVFTHMQPNTMWKRIFVRPV